MWPPPQFGVCRWAGGWQEAAAAEAEAAQHKRAGGSSSTTNRTVPPEPLRLGEQRGLTSAPRETRGLPPALPLGQSWAGDGWQLLPGMWGRGWLAPGTAEL